MYRTSPIKTGQICVWVGKRFSTRAGTVVGAVRLGGLNYTQGDATANRYDYYSGGVVAVRSLASLNVIAGHKE